MQAEAFFLQCDSPEAGQRFCIFHPAVVRQNEPTKGLVLYLHPFAEEMNKSRRMAALQSRALAKAGYAVLQIDLLGCGDSSGDFGDATWDAWLDDVALGLKYLRTWEGAQVGPEGQPLHEMTGVAGLAGLPLWLWGLRAGCLLAVDGAKRLGLRCNFLFWQPPASGKALLQQFLRLKVAGDLASGQGKGMMDEMRRQLADGGTVEIAGYALSSGLAAGLEHSVLASDALQPGGRLAWLEVSTREDATFSPVAEKSMALWRSHGFQTRTRLVRGPAFWQTSEIEDAPELIGATLNAIAARAA